MMFEDTGIARDGTTRAERDARRRREAELGALRREVVKALAKYKRSIAMLREAREVLARAEARHSICDQKSRENERKL